MFPAKRWHRPVWVILGVLLFTSQAIAQAACPSLVTEALDALDDLCSGLTRNQACYGNVRLEATAQSGVEQFRFEQVGDIEEVNEINTLTLSPMDEAAGTWGVVMMQLQADIPDTLPGQNVTFLMFGDVEITNNAVAGQSPMQAFTLKTGVGDSLCQEAPESGVLIQTPEGVESVNFNVNGVNMEVGSTVMLQAVPGDALTVSTVEGAAVMAMEGQSFPVICGTEFRIPLGEDLLPNGLPEMPIPCSRSDWAARRCCSTSCRVTSARSKLSRRHV